MANSETIDAARGYKDTFIFGEVVFCERLNAMTTREIRAYETPSSKDKRRMTATIEAEANAWKLSSSVSSVTYLSLISRSESESRARGDNILLLIC